MNFKQKLKLLLREGYPMKHALAIDYSYKRRGKLDSDRKRK